MNIDAWVSVLRHVCSSDVRACGLVCSDLRTASVDDGLWRQQCYDREVARGMDADKAWAWVDEMRARARLPSFLALHSLLERTGCAAGVGYWRSLSRQPVGAMLHTSWEEAGSECALLGTLTRRATPAEDPLLGLRADIAFALRPMLEVLTAEDGPRAAAGPHAAARPHAVRVRFEQLGQWCSVELCYAQAHGEDGDSVEFSPNGHALAIALQRSPLWEHPIHRGLCAHSQVELFARLRGSGLHPSRAVAPPRELLPAAGALAGPTVGALAGLYVSRYGSHGLELVEVRLLGEGEPDEDALDPLGVSTAQQPPPLPPPHGETRLSPTARAAAMLGWPRRSPRSYSHEIDARLPPRLVCRKVLGDENVPAGFVTLYAPLAPVERAGAAEPLGPCPVLARHHTHLRTSGIEPGRLAAVLRGQIQYNRRPREWRPEWDSILLFALAPSAGSGRMREFAALWRTVASADFLLAFSEFDARKHAWRPTDPASGRRAVAESVPGVTFVGAWDEPDAQPAD
jgi:hypothetical protein